jgi:AraC-binding-like domain
MKLNALHMGCLTAGYLRYGPEVGMRTAQAGHYHVNIALSGAVRSRCGRRDEVDSARSQASVFMPGDPADILWGAGSAQLCMMLDRDRVDRELESLLGRPLDRALEFDVGMDLTTSAAAAWMHSVELVLREASRPNGLTRFPLAARTSRAWSSTGCCWPSHTTTATRSPPEPLPAALGLCARPWSSSRSSPTGLGRPPASRRGLESARGPCRRGSRARSACHR